MTDDRTRNRWPIISGLAFGLAFVFGSLIIIARWRSREADSSLRDTLYGIGLAGAVASMLAGAGLLIVGVGMPFARNLTKTILATGIVAGSVAVGTWFSTATTPDTQPLPHPVVGPDAIEPEFSGDFTFHQVISRGESVVCTWRSSNADTERIAAFWTDGDERPRHLLAAKRPTSRPKRRYLRQQVRVLVAR